MSRPNQKRRLIVRCPKNRWPMGGGVKTNPPLSAGGEGVYPHSYERLGVQGGFHTTPVLWDPTPRNTQRRTVKLQVMCGRKLGKVTPPHSTKYVKPGKTKTVIATCPGRRHLFGGGFQRTDFISRGGNFVTESHAISSKSWKVVAHAFGNFGGEITAIAYCVAQQAAAAERGLGLDHDREGPGRHGEDVRPAPASGASSTAASPARRPDRCSWPTATSSATGPGRPRPSTISGRPPP